MSIIRILSENVSNRIAAGEVIERPASVVKELIENSIDASATKIIVKIEKAGKKLISITDNGSGMDEDDTILCFEPHATSKITTIEDMDKICTMGFRGEALPSIASISRFRVRTKKEGTLSGNEVLIEGGRFISSSPVGCAPGTEMSARDLFFNTPARRKFLKTDNTEEKHIIDLFSQIALAHHKIAFDLIIDGNTIISSPSDNNLLPRIQTIFGKTLKNSMLPMHFEKNGITIDGYIAKHGYTKRSRKEQRTYINSRPVESFTIYRGIRDGYESLVMKGFFPPVILFLNMEPNRVDFNVHPAKREVRFREAGIVSNVITDAIRETLRGASAPTTTLPSELPFNAILSGATINYTPAEKEQKMFPEFATQPQIKSTDPFRDSSLLPEIVPEINIEPLPNNISSISPAPITTQMNNEESLQVSQVEDDNSEQETARFEILAFLDETYILASSDSGLVIIDQHAAHERILFEQLMANSANKESFSQKLLLPVTVELSRSEIQFVKKNVSQFNELGFEIEPFGQNTIIIHAIPTSFKEEDASTFFSNLITAIFNEESTSKATKATIAKLACTKAVKAHDKLTLEEAKALVDQMNKCQLPYSCPHGRPTIISISYKELEKRFGRI